MITHVGTQTVETERLILRPFTYEDNEAMLKYWIADEKIQSLYGEPVYTTKEEVKELLDKYINNYKNDNYYRWAIVLKGRNECIGQIAYFLYDNGEYVDRLYYSILRNEFIDKNF